MQRSRQDSLFEIQQPGNTQFEGFCNLLKRIYFCGRWILLCYVAVVFCYGCSPAGKENSANQDNKDSSDGRVAYTILEEDKSIKNKIVVSILAGKGITEAEITSLLKKLCASYKVLYQYVNIWMFTSKDQYESGMKYLAIAEIRAMGDEPLEMTINKDQLEYLRVDPIEKFGFSEDKRKEIFKAIYRSDDMATIEAIKKYPYLNDIDSGQPEGAVREQNRKRSQLREILFEKYKSELVQKYTLTYDHLNEISVEGGLKKWPIQSSTEFEKLKLENTINSREFVKLDGVSMENNQLVVFISLGGKMSSMKAGDNVCGWKIVQIYSPREPDGITSLQSVDQYGYRIKMMIGQEEKVFKNGDVICVDPNESGQQTLSSNNKSRVNSSVSSPHDLEKMNNAAHDQLKDAATESIYKRFYREAVAQYETALNFDNSFQNAKSLDEYKTLLPKAKNAYATTDMTDKKKLHEIIEISERREQEISKYMEAVRDIKGRFNSAESLSKWLRKDIHYKSDRIASDYWQPPDETLRLKTGDCEDFAVLIQALLGEIGIQSEIVFVGFKKESRQSTHAICVFQKNGLYGYFDGPYIHRPFALSIQQLVDKKYSVWSAIAKINFPTRTTTFIARR